MHRSCLLIIVAAQSVLFTNMSSSSCVWSSSSRLRREVVAVQSQMALLKGRTLLWCNDSKSALLAQMVTPIASRMSVVVVSSSCSAHPDTTLIEKSIRSLHRLTGSKKRPMIAVLDGLVFMILLDTRRRDRQRMLWANNMELIIVFCCRYMATVAISDF